MSPADEEDRVQEGKYVVVQRGDHQRIIVFKPQHTICFGKGQSQQEVELKNALGCEFYSAFRIVPSSSPAPANVTPNKNSRGNVASKLYSLENVDEPASRSFNQLTFEAPSSVPCGKDNRNLLDDTNSQLLGHSDICSLKDKGLSSSEIVSTLVSSSKSFASKTEYSQEKYLKKKEKIHGDLLLFLKPELALITEYYFKKDPLKVLGLRGDTLSQILSYADIHAGGKYIIYENAAGLLVAACLERMGGIGTLIHCHAGTNAQSQALSFLNLEENQMKPLKDLDAFYLIEGREIGKKAKNGIKETEEEETLTEPSAKKIKTDEIKEQLSTTLTNRELNEQSFSLLKASDSQGLVICGKEHPLSILQRLLPHLSLSSPFVIYSAYPEPLMECYMWMKEKGWGANMNIVDNWLRILQIESDRTHPEINMSSSGGFILYGTYVRS